MSCNSLNYVLYRCGDILAEVVPCPERFVFSAGLGMRIRPYDSNPLALSVCEKHIDLERRLQACLLFKHFFDFFFKISLFLEILAEMK